MAGIEKICEFSGEYPGGAMYAYKRDLIQVMPEHRKEFYDQEHVTLVMFEPELRYHVYDTFLVKALSKYFVIRKFWLPRTWSKFRKCYTRKSLSWDYCLIVPSVQGDVRGMYFNYTSDPIRMFRKISKLVGDLKVKEVFQMHCTLDEWFENRTGSSNAHEDLIKLIFTDEAADEIIKKMKEVPESKDDEDE